MKKIWAILVLTTLGGTLSAQTSGYYDNATGTGATLKTSLYNIIKGHTVKTYDELWTAFTTTDKTSAEKVWDMYSNCSFTFTTKQCGNFTAECQCYNREHSFPKSWFGGEVSPMYTDLFHLYPTDGYVNNRRGNVPFGTVKLPTYTSGNGSKLGPCSYPGYTSTVFEPVDDYKGDFARSYFYMATRYEDLISGWNVNADAQPVLNGTSYPCFDPWFLNLLLEWNAADPVSQKEIARNEAVYAIQQNRNPFIDHPEYVEAVWPYQEPANHVTNFTATAISNTSVMVTWTDATGTPLPTKYLVKAVAGTGNPTAPADGTPEADTTLVKNVARGTQQVVFTGLTANGQYTFQIWPYNHAGSQIKYKTDGTVPSKTVTATLSAESYSWEGTTNNDWSTATNWNPNRNSTAATDILNFNNGNTITVTGVPTQTIGKLIVSNNTKVTLQPTAANTLSINGGPSALFVTIGSELNISGSTALTIAVAANSTGSIYGGMTFSGGAHRLTASDASGITFNNGAIFTAGTGFTGNAFGDKGTTNSIVFSSGSAYIAIAGANPFGTTGGICQFKTGSLYKHQVAGVPSFSGRTYANFEWDVASTQSATGGSAFICDDLTITQGGLNINMTGTPGHTIKGNITIGYQATMSFSPASSATITFGGTEPQTISVAGTLTSASNATLVCNNPKGISLDGKATLSGPLTIAAGSFTVNPGSQLTVSGALTKNATATGLVVESEGSLITSNAVAATVKRNIPAATWTDLKSGWHFLSSPVAAQAISGDFTPTGSGYDLYCWHEATADWVNFKDNSVDPKFATVNGDNFTPGRGYMVAYQNAATKSFTGTLNAGDQTFNTTKQGPGTYVENGWNLAGNPFASAIKWNDGTNWTVPATFAGTSKIWKEAAKAYVDIAANGIIPAGNGFMVQQVSGTTATLTIPQAARVHDATTNFYKSSEFYIKLLVSENENSSEQECNIFLNEKATDGYDIAYDSRFLPGYAPQLFSIAGSEHLSTNTLPDLGSNRVIELGFVKNDASGYTLTCDQASAIPWITVFLSDKKTGTETNHSENPVYTFTAASGDAENRFALHFVGSTSLQPAAAAKGISAHVAGRTLHIGQTTPQEGKVYLFDATGKMLLAKPMQASPTQTVSLPDLSPGVYVLSIRASSGTRNQKVVISY